jgi:hypothetical protein
MFDRVSSMLAALAGIAWVSSIPRWNATNCFTQPLL